MVIITRPLFMCLTGLVDRERGCPALVGALFAFHLQTDAGKLTIRVCLVTVGHGAGQASFNFVLCYGGIEWLDASAASLCHNASCRLYNLAGFDRIRLLISCNQSSGSRRNITGWLREQCALYGWQSSNGQDKQVFISPCVIWLGSPPG